MPGTLLRRYKRFLADVVLEDGTAVLAHCPNPGAMTTCAEPGWRVWLSPADPEELASGKRKLAWTWEISMAGEVAVLVNTARPNGVVAEAVLAGQIPELAGYARQRAEARYGENSRVDLLLQGSQGACYVEVKSATLLLAPGLAGFPDAVTSRGARHLGELEARVRAGDRAVQLFLVGRGDADAVAPAEGIDPVYAAALRRAAAAGVEILAYRAEIAPEGLGVGRRLEVLL